MFKKSEYSRYEIATKRKLFDYDGMTEEQEEVFREELAEEQMEKIKTEVKTENVIIHILEDNHYCNEHFFYSSKKDIDDYLEYLAVKDGVDLVRFNNGNLGYIAYYNCHENGFEIIETEMTAEEFEEKYEWSEW